MTTAQAPMRVHKPKKRKNSDPPCRAETADKHVLYQEAVQAPETEIDFVASTFRALRGRDALSLREDFCGTAHFAAAWCADDPRRTALGVDIDPEPLDWGREHNVQAAGSGVAHRVHLLQADVREVSEPQVDVTCAFNFSYYLFETRAELRRYFEAARRGLVADGLLVLDAFGGTECYKEAEEETELEENDATYVWQQIRFNPIDHHMDCAIHFDFPDGSRLENAFTYSWRMWTLPEIRELLQEAGFSRVRVYWERYEEGDEDEDYLEGTGEYYETAEVENQESWVSYVVAEV